MNTQQLDYASIANYIEKNIHGRAANCIGDVRYNNLEVVMKYVDKAGQGDHVEIGTLHGASAIAAALIMNQRNRPPYDKVMCIDPLNGYYASIAPREDMLDLQSGVPVTSKVLYDNLWKFGVNPRVIVNSVSSRDADLNDWTFSTAYIDGDHQGEAPWLDWLLVKDRTTEYVLFDNYDDIHPDVCSVCEKASKDPDWEFVEVSGITYVLKRVK